jgi:hypothetical protein
MSQAPVRGEFDMSMTSTLARVFMILAALAFSGVADAQPRPGGGPRGGGGGGGGGAAPSGVLQTINAEQLAQIFGAAGFPSKVFVSNNHQMVRTQFWPGDIYSGVSPEICEKDGNCRGYRIFANLGADTGVGQEWLDAWNQGRLYVHAYKLQNGELVFYWDVALLSGLTPQAIAATAQIFKQFVDQSTDFKAGQ